MFRLSYWNGFEVALIRVIAMNGGAESRGRSDGSRTRLTGSGLMGLSESLPLFFEGMRSGAHALLFNGCPRARSPDRKQMNSPNPQLTGDIWCLIVPLALSS